jgi:hypothetical protein
VQTRKIVGHTQKSCRIKKAVKILESMNVLDMSAGLMDGDDDGMYDDR